MKVDDLTLIVNVHNRHNLLQRNLDYYSQFEIKTVVCDSSSEPFSLAANYNQIDYLYYRDASYPWKLKEALLKVNTKYSVICADDDFIIADSLKKCVDFLDMNSDYSSVQGHYISFLRKNNKIEYQPIYMNSIGRNISGDTSLLRFSQLFASYIQLLYCVHKTENLLTSFKLSTDHLENHNLIELLVASIGVINGKHKVLPIFYSAREILEHSAGTYMLNLSEIKNNNQYNYEYHRFIDIVTDCISKKSHENYTEIRKKIIKSICSDYLLGNDIDLITKIKYFALKFSVSNILLSKPKIKKILQNIIRSFRKDLNVSKSYVNMTKEIPGFPFFDLEAKKELEVIEKQISDPKYY